MHLCWKAVAFFFFLVVFEDFLYLWNSWRVWRKEEWGIGWNRVLARYGRAACGCCVPTQWRWRLAHGWTPVSMLPCALLCLGSQGCPAHHHWICCGHEVLPSLRTPQAGSSHHRATHPWHSWAPWCPPGPGPTIPTILCANPDLCSPLPTDVPGLALGRSRPLCPAAELHEHFCQLVWLYAADPLADEARPRPLQRPGLHPEEEVPRHRATLRTLLRGPSRPPRCGSQTVPAPTPPAASRCRLLRTVPHPPAGCCPRD